MARVFANAKPRNGLVAKRRKQKMKEKFFSMRKKVIFLLTVVLAVVTGALVFLGSSSLNFAQGASVTIKPFALYEFEDSSNLGKDTSGNGFHLSAKGTPSSGVTGSDRYLSVSGNSGLYATAITGIKDFSDYITGSYTVRMVIRSSVQNGGNYLLTTGRYASSFTVVNNSSIEIYAGNNDLNNKDSSKMSFTQSATDWIDLVIVGDATNNVAKAYVNGVQKASINTKIKFSLDPDQINEGYKYSFCIGMQGNTVGGANAQYATCDYKKVEVYNTALTASNVSELYSSDKATASTYVTAVTPDLTGYNVNVTDKNTIEDVAKSLPSTVAVQLSNGSTVQAKAEWLIDPSNANNVKCALMDDRYVNANQLSYTVAVKKGVHFEYDRSLLTVSDVKIDGSSYTPSAEVSKDNYTLTFKAVPTSSHVIFENVKYHDLKWASDSNGYFTIDVTTGGAMVVLNAGLRAYKVTYYDDETVLGVSRYTYNGSESLYEWNKTGYTFEGWYTEESFSNKVTALPYSNPTDLTLYAKFVKIPTGYKIYQDVNFDSEKGTLTGFVSGKEYAKNSTVNVTVTPKSGYRIVSVLYNNEAVTVTNTAGFTFSKIVDKESTVMASFQKINTGVVVTVNCNDMYKGKVTGVTNGSEYEKGSSLNITVLPYAGYCIQSISWNSETISVTDENLMNISKTITEDSVLTVNFAVKTYNVSITNNNDKGVVSGINEGTVPMGSYVVTVTPISGYYIQSVTLAGVPVSVTGANGFSFTVNVSRDLSLVVVYGEISKDNSATVTITNYNGQGTVTGIKNGNSYAVGYKVSITINAQDGYVISSIKWNDTEITVSPETTEMQLSLTIEKDTNLQVTYDVKEEGDDYISNSSNSSGCTGAVNSPLMISFVAITLGLAFCVKSLVKKED